MNAKIGKICIGITLAIASICSSSAFGDTTELHFNVGNAHTEGTSAPNGIEFNYSALPKGLYSSSCNLNLVPTAGSYVTVSYYLIDSVGYLNYLVYSSMGNSKFIHQNYSGPFQVVINNTGQGIPYNEIHFQTADSESFIPLKYTIDCQTYPVLTSSAKIYNFDPFPVTINPKIYSDNITGEISITDSHNSTTSFTTFDTPNNYVLAAGPTQYGVTYTANTDGVLNASIGITPNAWPLAFDSNRNIVLNDSAPHLPSYDFEPSSGRKDRMFSNAAPDNFDNPTKLVYSPGSMVVCTIGASTIDDCQK